MKKIFSFFEGPVAKFEVVLAAVSMVIVMIAQFINAFGRKLYMPFPCTLELAESLMIVIVFLGIGYVALAEEHTQVTIVTRRMRPSVKRYLDAAAYLFATVIFGILAYGAWPIAWWSAFSQEIRIGVYDFPVWLFRIFFALGLSMMTLRCLSNTIKFFRQASDPTWKKVD
jgi:TRAP-type C4-dicarboxylate transport system permease small subunit